MAYFVGDFGTLPTRTDEDGDPRTAERPIENGLCEVGTDERQEMEWDRKSG